MKTIKIDKWEANDHVLNQQIAFQFFRQTILVGKMQLFKDKL